MPDPYRLKIKIGDHEFEAEGDPAVVHEQFQSFKELISLVSTISPQPPKPNGYAVPPPELAAPPKTDVPASELAFDKIMRVDGRIISLTIRPGSAEGAVLLLLLGQKLMRNNDSVSGAEIMDGLTATGGLSVARADRLLEKLARDGDVILFGERRSKRYRLTNTGLSKARSLAADLIGTVA